MGRPIFNYTAALNRAPGYGALCTGLRFTIKTVLHPRRNLPKHLEANEEIEVGPENVFDRCWERSVIVAEKREKRFLKSKSPTKCGAPRGYMRYGTPRNDQFEV